VLKAFLKTNNMDFHVWSMNQKLIYTKSKPGSTRRFTKGHCVFVSLVCPLRTLC
jgi:hypothetical protein